MPLLPQTRDVFNDSTLNDVEDLLDRLVTEVGVIVDTGVEAMIRLRDHKHRLTRIRSAFDAARETTEEQGKSCT